VAVRAAFHIFLFSTPEMKVTPDDGALGTALRAAADADRSAFFETVDDHATVSFA
jgi:hypothetical protein